MVIPERADLFDSAALFFASAAYAGDRLVVAGNRLKNLLDTVDSTQQTLGLFVDDKALRAPPGGSRFMEPQILPAVAPFASLRATVAMRSI